MATIRQPGRHGPMNAHLGMLAHAILVGLSFPVVGLLSEGLPPLLLTAIRFAIATLALWPLIRQEPDCYPTRAGLLLYMVMGLCLAGFFSAMFWAAHHATALSMAAIYVSGPLIAYGFGRAFGVEPRAGVLLSILALGAAGALMLGLVETGGWIGDLRIGAGEAVFLAGCIALSLYPVLSKWGLQRGWLSPSAGLRTFWSAVIGCALIGILGLFAETPGNLARLTLSDLALLVYLGVFSSGVTFWLLQRATAVLTPATVTGYSYFVPFVSMVIVFIEEPARIGWQWLPGSVLVLLTIALLLRGAASQRPAVASLR